MASETANKKGIIDFLWEWADGQGDWAKLLIETIVNTESNLSSAERTTVFEYFVDQLRLTKKMPARSFNKPSYNPTTSSLFLTAISDITGVNKLAKDQRLVLNKNVTVIYGENGTGKTGYSRILKSLGISHDTNSKILHNVYGSQEPKSAKIEYESNSVSKSVNWDGKSDYPELSSISIFNNNCVSFSIADRNLMITPIGFHLFGIVTKELQELTILLKEKINGFTVTLPWINQLNVGTRQFEFLTSLNEKSSLQTLKNLSTFSLSHESELTKKEADLTNLNTELIKNQISQLAIQKAELKRVIDSIRDLQPIFNNGTYSAFIDLKLRISSLQDKTQSSIEKIALLNGVDFYDSIEFKSFLQAAENYLRLLEKGNYPEQDDTCIYCKQPLSQTANELLKSYKSILNDSAEIEVNKSQKELDVLMNTVGKVNEDVRFIHPVFGLNENQSPVQPPELLAFITQLKLFKKCFEEKDSMGEQVLNFDFSILFSCLDNRMKEINTELAAKEVVLSDVSGEQIKVKAEINALKDRKTISEKIEDITNVIKHIGVVRKLEEKLKDFNSIQISKKTTAARDELIKNNFETIFQRELAAFRKSSLPIEINFGTSKGNSTVQQRIKNFSLSEILSEGEQKAIALAEFLTELQVDNTTAPVIFDDPVNSLDHKIIDEVVKRLIILSKTRQVVIFTHSVLLLHSFMQQKSLDTSRQENIGFAFYTIKSNANETGIVEEGGEELNSFSYYKSKLMKVLSERPGIISEERLAAEGYGHLRSMIEVCVEQEVLKKIIMRYGKGVAFPSLLRIEGEKIDAHKSELNDIYEKCCTSIAGHSSAAGVAVTPTITDLKEDVEKFAVLRKQFSSN